MLIILGILFAGAIFFVGYGPPPSSNRVVDSSIQATFHRKIYRLPNFLLSRIFPETITPEDIKSKYQTQKVRVLLIPGHDNVYSGAQFGTLEEADLSIRVGRYLYELFEKDSHFEVTTTRNFTSGEYTNQFNNYFAKEKDSILSFMRQRRELMKDLLSSGAIKENVTIEHNFAPGDTAVKLYGINKWANENNIDLSLHIHFNDYPGRRWNRPGKYTGFSIYVPEEQYSNARASRELAVSVSEQLKKYFPVSNFPKESEIIIEAQELIALGSNASQEGGAVLVEYGYIYESRFINSRVRNKITNELALQTYQGIKKYFDPQYSKSGFQTSLLPHKFNQNLTKGIRANTDVLALQAALQAEGLYPPDNRNLNSCPINGNFGPCTEAAVISFQEKYHRDILKPTNLSRGTGFVGFYTLKKLNELYEDFSN